MEVSGSEGLGTLTARYLTCTSTDQIWFQIWYAHWQEPELLTDKADFTSGTGNLQDGLGTFCCSKKPIKVEWDSPKKSQKTANGALAGQRHSHAAIQASRQWLSLVTIQNTYWETVSQQKENFEETKFRIQLIFLQTNATIIIIIQKTK